MSMPDFIEPFDGEAVPAALDQWARDPDADDLALPMQSEHVNVNEVAEAARDAGGVALPFLLYSSDEFTAELVHQSTLDTEGQLARRWEIVTHVFETADRSLDAVPEPWKSDPLRAWCWLVLVLNGIDFDPEHPRSLAEYGLDLSFAPLPVQHFAFVLA